MRSYY